MIAHDKDFGATVKSTFLDGFLYMYQLRPEEFFFVVIHYLDDFSLIYLQELIKL